MTLGAALAEFPSELVDPPQDVSVVGVIVVEEELLVPEVRRALVVDHGKLGVLLDDSLLDGPQRIQMLADRRCVDDDPEENFAVRQALEAMAWDAELIQGFHMQRYQRGDAFDQRLHLCLVLGLLLENLTVHSLEELLGCTLLV